MSPWINNPADEISQQEKRNVLKNDKLVRDTYHSRALADAELEFSGRFKATGKPTVSGSEPLVRYPLQATSPWNDAGVPPEPPTGYAIDQLEPVGENHEVQASLNAPSSPLARVATGDGASASPDHPPRVRGRTPFRRRL